MVLDSDPVVFLNWLRPALFFFLQAAAVLCLAAVVGGFLLAAFRYGPGVGGDATYRMIKIALSDLVSLSPRRIGALARLAVQESLRRRVLVGFGVFLLILLFAGWFLDTKSHDPATLYLSFVLTATTYLVLLMALFLSAFSLPADIKNKTIYTIVTKPVRPGEIVLGRIVGFSLIGTLLLAVMGLFSYFFVVRVLNHTHEVDIVSLKSLPGDAEGGRTGRTTLAQNHRHHLTLDADGNGSTDIAQGHWHEIDKRVDGDKTTYVLGPPQDLLTARVPAYGNLRFKDRAGRGVSTGINVGNEWKYRSFVEGGTLATAIWNFKNITPENYPQGLPIEMTIRVFRSYKGDIEQGIRGVITLKNPINSRTSELRTFTAKDFSTDHMDIPRKLSDKDGNPIDLFDDLAPNGELELWLQCVDESQYFGVAQADVYLRAHDASFAMNFVKSYLGIWVQMLLVTSFGVMFSTFLSGAVAMMATLAALVLGFFTKFVFDVAQGTVQGGGPLESFIRIVKQQNVTLQMEPGLATDVVKGIDAVFMFFMQSVTSLLPDFRQFSTVDYLAHGFDIPADVVGVQFFSGLGYLAAVIAIGYLFLRTREVAR
ncbi:MAG TPA: ABC transporter permease [Pirellulales bacterium]|nr:ABC transporter permease [Pirellulales bacterium]